MQGKIDLLIVFKFSLLRFLPLDLTWSHCCAASLVKYSEDSFFHVVTASEKACIIVVAGVLVKDCGWRRRFLFKQYPFIWNKIDLKTELSIRLYIITLSGLQNLAGLQASLLSWEDWPAKEVGNPHFSIAQLTWDSFVFCGSFGFVGFRICVGYVFATCFNKVHPVVVVGVILGLEDLRFQSCGLNVYEDVCVWNTQVFLDDEIGVYIERVYSNNN